MHPTLLHIGHLYVPTFGLLAALGLLAAAYLSLRTARLVGVSPDEVWDAGLFAVLAAFVASRVLLVLFNFRSFLSAPILLLMVPSLTAAGLGLAALAVAVYLRRKDMPVLRVMDAWAAPAALLWAFLAMGHLAEGSDPGLPSRFGLRTSLAGYREQPVALYAAVLALGLAVLLYRLLQRRQAAGWVAGVGLVLVGVVQFGLTFVRMPYVYAPASAMTSLDPVQWVAVGMVVVGAVLMIWRWRGTEAISPLRPAAFGRDDSGDEGMRGRDDGGVAAVVGRRKGAVGGCAERNTGVSPLRPPAFGRDDDGGEGIPGREFGALEDSGVVRRERSMHEHQVREHGQQVSREETRGTMYGKES